MKKCIQVNSKLCNGCRTCAMACSLRKSGRFNHYLTGVWIDSDDLTGANVPRLCRQCRNPACVKACPAEKTWQEEAPFDPPIYRDEQTGGVHLDTGKASCLGCKECMTACPFGAIRIVPEDDHLVKCDLCGGDPECVKFCPTGALKYGDITHTPAKA